LEGVLASKGMVSGRIGTIVRCSVRKQGQTTRKENTMESMHILPSREQKGIQP